MARTKKPTKLERRELSIRSIALTAEEARVLDRLSQAASDFLGRAISTSAVIRALIRQRARQASRGADALFLEIERELTAGVLWGKRKVS